MIRPPAFWRHQQHQINSITQFIPGTIQASKHPIDHIKEQALQNDPIIKLKKNIPVASQKQLQQVTKQTKQSLQKQIVKKDNEWEP